MLVSSPSLAVDFVAVKRVVEAITSTPIPETIFPCAVLPEWFLLSFTWVSHVSKEKLILHKLHKPRHTDV